MWYSARFASIIACRHANYCAYSIYQLRSVANRFGFESRCRGVMNFQLSGVRAEVNKRHITSVFLQSLTQYYTSIWGLCLLVRGSVAVHIDIRMAATGCIARARQGVQRVTI